MIKTAAQLADQYLDRQIAQTTDPKVKAKFEEARALLEKKP